MQPRSPESAPFGTVAAYAKELGLKEDFKQLSVLTKDVYAADEYSNQLAKTPNASANAS